MQRTGEREGTVRKKREGRRKSNTNEMGRKEGTLELDSGIQVGSGFRMGTLRIEYC